MTPAVTVPGAASQTEMLTRSGSLLRINRHDDSLCEIVTALSCIQLLTPHRCIWNCNGKASLGCPRWRGHGPPYQVATDSKYHALDLLKISQADKKDDSPRSSSLSVVSLFCKGLSPPPLLAGLPRSEMDAHCVHHWYHRNHSLLYFIAHRLHYNVWTIYRHFTD